jgi:anti-anti-sigma factor
MAFGERTFGERVFGQATLVRAAGAIDGLRAGAFEAAMLDGVTSAAVAVIVDMAELETIGVADLRVLMSAERRARAAGKAMALAAPTPLVREILAITRTDRVFDVYDGVREALAATAPDALGAFDRSAAGSRA